MIPQPKTVIQRQKMLSSAVCAESATEYENDQIANEIAINKNNRLMVPLLWSNIAYIPKST